jgi:hypothetical protein
MRLGAGTSVSERKFFGRVAERTRPKSKDEEGPKRFACLQYGRVACQWNGQARRLSPVEWTGHCLPEEWTGLNKC